MARKKQDPSGDTETTKYDLLYILFKCLKLVSNESLKPKTPELLTGWKCVVFYFFLLYSWLAKRHLFHQQFINRHKKLTVITESTEQNKQPQTMLTEQDKFPPSLV